jgi:hypothetical protein
MLPLIYLAGAAIVSAAVVAIFWKEIVSWLGRVYEKLPASVKDNLKGGVAFVKKVGDTFKNLMLYYSYNEDTQKWTETTVSREVDSNSIPAHILKKLESTEKLDITEELEMQFA